MCSISLWLRRQPTVSRKMFMRACGSRLEHGEVGEQDIYTGLGITPGGETDVARGPLGGLGLCDEDSVDNHRQLVTDALHPDVIGDVSLEDGPGGEHRVSAEEEPRAFDIDSDPGITVARQEEEVEVARILVAVPTADWSREIILEEDVSRHGRRGLVVAGATGSGESREGEYEVESTNGLGRHGVDAGILAHAATALFGQTWRCSTPPRRCTTPTPLGHRPSGSRHTSHRPFRLSSR